MGVGLYCIANQKKNRFIMGVGLYCIANQEKRYLLGVGLYCIVVKKVQWEGSKIKKIYKRNLPIFGIGRKPRQSNNRTFVTKWHSEEKLQSFAFPVGKPLNILNLVN